MSGSERTGIIVSAAEERHGALDDLAAELRTSGMDVESILDDAGLITGTAPNHALAALRAIRGVAHIELEQGVSIAPPDSETQ